ncbi:unnamed protein product [Dovyalis caffra]|uniref:Uncharacterized protein n=1 Tax=Dovyalis caffra TaxID=77055 RepID=A0AAV1R481_9ROSI|nr:unnamed protein product [Dovyalis caffra]
MFAWASSLVTYKIKKIIEKGENDDEDLQSWDMMMSFIMAGRDAVYSRDMAKEPQPKDTEKYEERKPRLLKKLQGNSE